MRERVGVYLRGLVESPVVDAEPRRSILFLYQDGGTTPRTVAFLDDAYCQHVLDQLPFLFSARSRVTPDSLLYCGLVARVDPVLDDVSASEVAFSFGKCLRAAMAICNCRHSSLVRCGDAHSTNPFTSSPMSRSLPALAPGSARTHSARASTSSPSN